MTPWEKFKIDWKGKKVLIMGLGLQGRGIGDAKIFCEAGSQVAVTDLKNEVQLQSAVVQLKDFPVRFVLGKHDEEDFRSYDLVLRNPDVPESSHFLKIAANAGIQIKMDSSLFAKYCPFPVIGITGTRGKTTTTMMIYEVLKKLYKGNVCLGGNIQGKATLELLPGLQKGIAVLELSSWELQGWHDEKISPHISVFTNFYQDHLNRYASMSEYLKDKLAVAEYQNRKDWLIAGPEVKLTVKNIKSRLIRFSAADLPKNFKLQIPGEHNRANAAAALSVTRVLELKDNAVLKILSKFPGVPYRLETIAVIDGVEYINDTTSTTPAAGIEAIRAMTKPIVLIAGGSSKKLDLKPLAEEILDSYRKHRVKRVILLKGEGTDELMDYLEGAGSRLIDGVCDDFGAAVTKARNLAISGDTVLLSPGCASFSMFNNEFDRGDQFNQIVRKWQIK
ncbi:UDP-N-acetylmuramoyl-L-alanine--D-glutamate ligase [Candidatus Collierbacteria bacterium]|nr:UDP-N-acetylmuramoyl-L-alanine--D-glutamate ligase [Candidatus Collierbacteria bacterium]